MKKTIGAICIMLTLSCLFSACNGAKTPEITTAGITTEAPTEAITEAPDPGPELGVVETLELEWKRGFVASAYNVNATSAIMDGATLYSYTGLFTIPYAGTKVTFQDTVVSGSGGAGYASDNAYVFSVWQENGDGTWSLDGTSMQFPGVGFADSVISSITDKDRKILTYTYVTARNNETLRICYYSGELSGDENKMTYPTVTAEYTGEKSSAELYREENRAIFEWIESTKANAYYSVLEGKTINFIGDSYFAGNGLNKNYVWPALLSVKYGISCVNHGVNGSTISVTSDNKNPMVKRYGKLPANDPDIVVVEGGRNDRSQNVAGKGAAIGENNTTDESTFKGALTAIIRGLKAKYPNAMILCVTAWRVNDGTTEYGTAMKEVCAFENVPCFDATNQAFCKVYMTDANFRKTYCMTETDVSHLNLEGMKLVMPVFEKFIAEEYAKFCAK